MCEQDGGVSRLDSYTAILWSFAVRTQEVRGDKDQSPSNSVTAKFSASGIVISCEVDTLHVGCVRKRAAYYDLIRVVRTQRGSLPSRSVEDRLGARSLRIVYGSHLGARQFVR